MPALSFEALLLLKLLAVANRILVSTGATYCAHGGVVTTMQNAFEQEIHLKGHAGMEPARARRANASALLVLSNTAIKGCTVGRRH